MATLLKAFVDPDVVAATGTARVEDLKPLENWIFNLAQPLSMWTFRLVFGYHCLSGFNFAIRRAAYSASGGFAADLNAEEDADLSRRVAKLGVIRMTRSVITFSGRRFAHGLMRGACDYVALLARYRLRRRSAVLSDIR